MHITFIGGGNMAQAIIGGLITNGQSATAIRVVEIKPETRKHLEKQFGVECFSTGEKAALENAQVVVLAVKPQHMRQVALQIGPLLTGQIVLSIAAGIQLKKLMRWLGAPACTLVRAMPNTPALIGRGITGLIYYSVPSKSVLGQDQIRTIEGITNSVGKSVWVGDEKEMDAVTAVSGSGPAYVFYFMEAIEQAAKELGLSAGIAHQLALSTFTGAAELAAQSTDAVSALRERVTSKGGTTEAALKSMAADHVKEAIVRAVKAAHARSRELGEEVGEG